MTSVILSSPKRVDLVVYKGDTGSFRITFVPEVGDPPIDVSDATWDGDIRLKAGDADVIDTFTIVPVVGDSASVDVILPATTSEALPKSCVYDVEMRRVDEVKTICYGSITVTQDVSRP